MVEVTKKADESCRKLTFNVDVSLVAQLHSYVTAYTANVYRDFIGKSECGDFKFMGIARYPKSL